MIDDQKKLAQIRNKEAATGGLALGLSLFIVIILDYLFSFSISAGYISSILNFALIAGLLYYFTKRYGIARGDLGMTYGNGYSFILLTMIFAGIIYGALYFVQSNYIDPAYYKNLQEQVIINNPQLTDVQKDQALQVMSGVMSNPLVVIISTIFSTLLMGAFVGLVVAVFTKRAPVLFNDEINEEEKEQESTSLKEE